MGEKEQANRVDELRKLPEINQGKFLSISVAAEEMTIFFFLLSFVIMSLKDSFDLNLPRICFLNIFLH